MSTPPERVLKPVTSRGQQTRRKLLDAAEAVFGERGYDNASIVEITQRAGVAQGTFYVYFPDKKAAFVELVRHLSHTLRQEIAEAVRGLDHRLEIERVGVLAFFRFTLTHQNLYRIVRQAEFVEPELYRWYYQRMADGYIKGLTAAIQAGQVRDLDPEALAYCLMAMGDFMGMRWVLWEGRLPPDSAIDAMMQFIRQGIGVVGNLPPA